MASSPPAAKNGGFATPAALVLSLCCALICAAFVARGVMNLRLSQAQLIRNQQALALDGAALWAETTIIRNGDSGPFRWSLTLEGVETEILAEPEAHKVGMAAAANLPNAIFMALGVNDIAALRDRLSGSVLPVDGPGVAGLDVAPNWAGCAPSAVSAFGKLEHLAYRPPSAPDAVVDPPAWRIGEVWRLRITTSAGWRDDRIVRFTGDPQHPAAVVSRAFTRVGSGGGKCDDLLAAIAGG